GGQNLLISFEDILSKLSLDEIKLLKETKVKIKVPEEFRKSKLNSSFIESSLFSSNTNPNLVRYRHDIIQQRENLNKNYLKALEKFEDLINLEKSCLIKYFNMRDDQILLVDNSRWLHGRTKILDLNRHFVRVRFNDNDDLINRNW
ncbi:unnamed protein product, partial [Brachionus calyciflorus]